MKSLARPQFALVLIVLLLAGCFGDGAPTDPGPASDAPDDASQTDPSTDLGTIDGLAEGGVSVKFYPTGRSGRVGGEPSVAVLSDGTIFTNAWDETLRSTDGGHTWTTVLDITLDVPIQQQAITFSGDPWLWADPVTDRIFTMHVLFPCSAFWWSDDKGETWTENKAGCIIPYNDRAQLTSGPPGPEPNPLAGVDYPSVLYRCYNGPVTQIPDNQPSVGYATVACGMSYDGGQSWPLEHVLSTQVINADFYGCRHLHNPAAVSKDGVVAVAVGVPSCEGLEVHISRDSGLTWEVIPGPRSPSAALEGNPSHPDLAWSANGALYAMWRGPDNLRYLARADTLDGQWSEAWQVSAPGVMSTDYQALQVGADGRLAIAYLGTRDTSKYAETVPPETRWHLFLAVTEEANSAAPSFVHVQATPDSDPVQIGCTRGSTDCSNLRDFIGSAVTPDGTFLVSFTDGCKPGCDTAGQSGGKQTIIAALDGWNLK